MNRKPLPGWKISPRQKRQTSSPARDATSNRRAMIAPTFMYREELRRTRKRALGITVGVAVVNTTIVSSLTGWGRFQSSAGVCLIISFCIGTLFWLNGPLIKYYGERLRPIPRWTVRILSAAIILNLGVMIGAAILVTTGAFPSGFKWTLLWDSVVPTTVIGVLCTIGF